MSYGVLSPVIPRCPMQRVVYGWLTCIICLLGYLPASGQGDMLIFPKRVVFEGRKNTEMVNLTNTGSDTATYHLSFIQMRMDENGRLEQITGPDTSSYFADPYIRYYPRIVTLAPQESQLIKLQTFKTGSLAPGEYRSHLYIRADPSHKPGEATGEDAQYIEEPGAISIRLIPMYGLTIPCIIRIGESTTSVTMSNLALERDSTSGSFFLKLDLHRHGNMSAYGHFFITHQAPDGTITTVARLKGIGVYTPGTLRRCKIRLSQSDSIDYSSGKLLAVYSAHEIRSVPIAQAELDLSH